MDFIIILITAISGGTIGGFISYFLTRRLEGYKFELRRREQSFRIAEFLAKWIKYRGKAKKFLSGKELIDYYEDLTKMSFEMSLWIKDEETLKKIMSRLAHEKGAIKIREILLEIRDSMFKSKTKSFKAKDIVTWPRKEDEDEIFGQK